MDGINSATIPRSGGTWQLRAMGRYGNFVRGNVHTNNTQLWRVSPKNAPRLTLNPPASILKTSKIISAPFANPFCWRCRKNGHRYNGSDHFS
jgi:hypothetical protein